jgi:hypothetical protein
MQGDPPSDPSSLIPHPSSARVLALLAQMRVAGQTPEEVCRGCPELLAEVRQRWREYRRIDTAVVESLPGLRTTPDVGAVTPVPPTADLLQVPGRPRRLRGHGRPVVGVRPPVAVHRTPGRKKFPAVVRVRGRISRIGGNRCRPWSRS